MRRHIVTAHRYLAQARLIVGAAVVSITFGLALFSAGIARADEPTSIAMLSSQMQNDHAEFVPTTDQERRRLAGIVNTFTSMLEKSGRYKFTPVSAPIQERISKDQQLGECAGCEAVYGKELGVSQVAWLKVQKVSELIANINIYITDSNSGKNIFMKSVDIRGNDNNSWQHAMKFLVKRYMLEPENYTTKPGE